MRQIWNAVVDSVFQNKGFLVSIKMKVQDGRYAKKPTKEMVINMNDTRKAAPLDPDLSFGFRCFASSCDTETTLDSTKLLSASCELSVRFFDKSDRIVASDDWPLDFSGRTFMIFVFLTCLTIATVIITYRIVIATTLDRVKKKAIL